MSSSVRVISVAARGSLLSRAQVQEVFCLAKEIHKDLVFIPSWIQTKGDIDQVTSLKELPKSDFFTKEVDEAVIRGECRIAIHSAKDLPELLPPELVMIACTEGVDPSDVVVFRKGGCLSSMQGTLRVGTSSYRRQENFRVLCPYFTAVDIRGPIEKRLQVLDEGGIDALILAKAALIRLRIDRDYMPLLGEIEPLQGRLAIIARKEDKEMEELFFCLHRPLS